MQFTFTKNEIEELYYKKEMTIVEIATFYGVNYSTMRRKMLNFGIKIRDKRNYRKRPHKFKHILMDSKSEEVRKLYENNIPCKIICERLKMSKHLLGRYIKQYNLKRTKSMSSRYQYDDSLDEKICNLYDGGKSSTEISEIIGKGHKTVLNHLHHCGVDVRNTLQGQYVRNKKDRPIIIDDPDKLYNLYVTNRMSKKTIGDMLNVSPNVIDRALKKYGIHVRDTSEAKIGIFNGAKHPNWKGGVTSLYTRIREFFSKYQIQPILKRDNYTCQMCGDRKNLQVHHIKHFKTIFYEIIDEHPEYNIDDNKEELFKIITNDSRMLDENNLITYCRDCHLFVVHGYEKGTKRKGND